MTLCQVAFSRQILEKDTGESLQPLTLLVAGEISVPVLDSAPEHPTNGRSQTFTMIMVLVLQGGDKSIVRSEIFWVWYTVC